MASDQTDLAIGWGALLCAAAEYARAVDIHTLFAGNRISPQKIIAKKYGVNLTPATKAFQRATPWIKRQKLKARLES